MMNFLSSINSQIVLSYSILENEYRLFFLLLKKINDLVFWFSFLFFFFMLGKFLTEIVFVGIIKNTWDFLFTSPIFIIVSFVMCMITGYDK